MRFLNNIPPVTKNFLLLNVILFLIMHVFIATGGTDISQYLSAHYINTPLFKPYQLITHMFMHSASDIMHIFFNMFLLIMFGAQLERLWGAKRFFIFYFAAGIGAFALDNIVNGIQVNEHLNAMANAGINVDALNNLVLRSNSMSNTAVNETFNQIVTSVNGQQDAIQYYRMGITSGVGASGAIFGLLTAFAILFPNTELYLMFIPVPVKAKYLIGAYVAYEIYKGFSYSVDNINHLAHVGGALTGAILVLIWRKMDRQNFY
ncbi:MAG: membrane associated rhomboid family serine protease [Lentimonas sp.]|jgi:membrane associated rhomboid family serine protease